MTTNVRVGSHVHVNVGCTLSHDVVLGDFATLSPGVHVSGHVHVEDGVFLGTGANIINGIAGRPLIIGRGAIVAAGACVTGPVEAGALVAGVPAIRKR
jgi:acetyltransferase-like isoleucine patch superfamily enzyme